MINNLHCIFITNSKILLFLLICVIIDTILGVSKSITNKNFTFSSSGLKKCIPKIIQYFCVVVLMVFVEFTFNIKSTLTICVLISLIEIKSISENLHDIPEISEFLNKIIKNIKERK